MREYQSKPQIIIIRVTEFNFYCVISLDWSYFSIKYLIMHIMGNSAYISTAHLEL